MTLSPPTRLIATDLDGTLLRPDRTISERSRRALHAARQQGLLVVLVTARQPYGMRQLARDAGLGGLAITSNGASIYDLDHDQLQRTRDLPAATARTVVTALRAALPGVCFAAVRQGGAQFHAEPAYARLVSFTDHHRGVDGMRLGDALGFCAADATKLTVRHPHLTPDELLDVLHGLGLDGFHATHSGAPFVEVLAAGVTKASALEQLAQEHGVRREEVVAFGDAPNDLPMLQWAGRAYAMANAHPGVLARIEATAPSNEEDGVAQVLERLLGLAVTGSAVG